MKKLALMALAAGMVVGGTGIASAQYYDPAYRNYPRYRDYDRPRSYYRERYRERGDYEERRSYRRGRVLSARPIPNLERVPTGMDCSGRCLQTLSGRCQIQSACMRWGVEIRGRGALAMLGGRPTSGAEATRR
jgi:hypothetical protein